MLVLFLNENNTKSLYKNLKLIFGLGVSKKLVIIKLAGFNSSKRIEKFFKLPKSTIEKIANEVSKFKIQRELLDEIKKYRKNLAQMRCYRAIRFYQNLPCHGQRTKTNAKTMKNRKKNTSLILSSKKLLKLKKIK